MRFAVVMSSFHEKVMNGLLEGAKKIFESNGVFLEQKDLFKVPGAFEIPLIAQKLAKTKKYDGILALGVVIKGETAHFEFISLSATIGLTQVILDTEVPIAFGVLTTYDVIQADARSLVDHPENKGAEAAHALVEQCKVLKSF